MKFEVPAPRLHVCTNLVSNVADVSQHTYRWDAGIFAFVSYPPIERFFFFFSLFSLFLPFSPAFFLSFSLVLLCWLAQ
jgi:hypothetical protein